MIKHPPSGQGAGGSKSEHAGQEHVQSLHTQILGKTAKHHAIPR
jgi:hypothetical protein